MRLKEEVETEIAHSILESMGHTIENIEARWPENKRGSNANREWQSLKDKRDAALLCLSDALAAMRSGQ
jgi:hypothetical protein